MKEEALNLVSLKENLEKLKVPKSYYRIGSYGEEALCIVFEGNQWIVFEGERGQRYNVHFFDKESDACQYYLQRIRIFL